MRIRSACLPTSEGLNSLVQEIMVRIIHHWETKTISSLVRAPHRFPHFAMDKMNWIFAHLPTLDSR